jgi:hypothetical protein
MSSRVGPVALEAIYENRRFTASKGKLVVSDGGDEDTTFLSLPVELRRGSRLGSMGGRGRRPTGVPALKDRLFCFGGAGEGVSKGGGRSGRIGLSANTMGLSIKVVLISRRVMVEARCGTGGTGGAGDCAVGLAVLVDAGIETDRVWILRSAPLSGSGGTENTPGCRKSGTEYRLSIWKSDLTGFRFFNLATRAFSASSDIRLTLSLL